MKKSILNWMGIAIMAGAIAFSLTQLKIPVVKAEGCPPAQAVGCGCMSLGHTSATYEDRTEWQCNYLCGGCSGGGNEMMIETMVQVTDWH